MQIDDAVIKYRACLSELAGQPREDHWLKRYLEDPEAFVAGSQDRLPAMGMLFERLWHGWMPGAFDLPAEAAVEFQRAYLRTYVEQKIKLTTQPGRSHARGIAALRDTYPQLRFAPGLVIAPCERSLQLSEHAWSLPWDIR